MATIVLKNPVDNDRLLDSARGVNFNSGNVNYGFVDEAEIRGVYNQLKPSEVATISNTASGGNNKRARRSRKNQVTDQTTDPSGIMSTTTIVMKTTEKQKREDDSDYEKMYEDEYDVANKIRKSNPNLQLIDSINKELKKVTTGYKADASNA